jgi:hypothetical protein
MITMLTDIRFSKHVLTDGLVHRYGLEDIREEKDEG